MTYQCCCLAWNILVLLRQWAMGHLRRLESFLCGLWKASVSHVLHHANSIKGRISPHCQNFIAWIFWCSNFGKFQFCSCQHFDIWAQNLYYSHTMQYPFSETIFLPLLQSWRTLEVIRLHHFLANWIDHSTSCFHFQNTVLGEFIITLLFTLLDLLT